MSPFLFHSPGARCCFNFPAQEPMQFCNEEGLEAQAEEQPLELQGEWRTFPGKRSRALGSCSRRQHCEALLGFCLWGWVFSPLLVFCFLWLQVWTGLWVTKLAERKQTQIICIRKPHITRSKALKLLCKAEPGEGTGWAAQPEPWQHYHHKKTL